MFVGNKVDGEELGIAYSTLDSNKYYEEIKSENKKKMATAIHHLDSLTNKDADIIDIGAGNGYFVELLNEAKFKSISAHEIQGSDLTRIRAISKNIYQDFNYSTIPDNSFDVVTLLDVVEHVIDPTLLINNCWRILKINGVIYFHTPVVTKTDKFIHSLLNIPILKKIGTVWQRARTSIFHLENYTPKSLTQLLHKAGFTDIEIEMKNELSWPVGRYARIYILEKQGLPGFLTPLVTPFVYPFIATSFFNSNKAIVSARKRTTPTHT